MILNKKNLVLTLVVGIIILLMIPTSGFSRIAANGSGGGYDGNDGGSSDKAGTQSINNAIEMYVIEGAGYYLNAYSDILVFLNRVEMSDLKGMDYNEAQQILDRALGNMNNAVKTYYYLIRRAEMTPYNENVIAKLMDFDYAGFMEQWKLNRVEFGKVEEYLRKGDITGMYKYIYGEFMEITRILYVAKEEIALGKMPELSNLWRLNECCSRILLFTQGASRIFYALR